MTIQRKLHDWTEADDARLAQAITDLDPLREQYSERGVRVDEYWAAVAGRLVPEVLVTGRACQARWHDLEQRRKAEEQPSPIVAHLAWEQVAARVEAYERELGEATYDELTGVNRRLDSMETMLASVAHEQQANAIEAKLDRLLAELGVRMGDGHLGAKP